MRHYAQESQTVRPALGNNEVMEREGERQEEEEEGRGEEIKLWFLSSQAL